jgi:hypothetical protein
MFNTEDKINHITKNILLAQKYGIKLIFFKESLEPDGYDLWLDLNSPDVFVIECKFTETYTTETPGFELETHDFLSMLQNVQQFISEVCC